MVLQNVQNMAFNPKKSKKFVANFRILKNRNLLACKTLLAYATKTNM